MNVYEMVTNKIIECLENGVIPWKRDWVKIPYSNYTTKKAYRGINQLLLFSQIISRKKEFSSPYWLTFNQIKKLKGKVKKGEKAFIIVFWNIHKIKEETLNKNGENATKEKSIPFLKYYNVFNYCQTEGLEEIKIYNNENTKDCEKIIKNMQNKPVIKYGVNPAYYPMSDYITMPSINNFKSSNAYFSVLYHETIHWTGNRKRLNRINDKKTVFGSKDYSKEELIAEIGSSFLCNIAGIGNEMLKNQASYIKGWLEVLNNDKKMIITASSQAQKAVDYILNKD